MTTKAVLRSIKNVTNGYSSAQILVRECTSNDPSSPTISKMAEVADLTYKNGSFQDVMDIIDKRLNDKGKNWRHVAKALTLLDYLVRYGSDDVVIWAKDNLYIIKTLREFNVTDSAGHDQGSIIRVKAKELSSLLQDDERLREEREAAQQSNSRGRRRNRNTNRSSRYDSGDDIYDEDLQRALEESKQTAEEEEYKRKTQTDESLERAIQLSLEEEEMRKKNQNLLDLNDDTNPPDVYGFYQQQQNQGQIIGYDMFGNPVYGNQPMATGYLQNAYQDLADQQLAQQQALYLQQQQQQQQQQLLYQQQLAAANQQMTMQTGSNNPFAMQQQQQQQQQQQLLYQQQQQELQLQQQAEEEARRKEEELKKQQQLLEEQQKILLEQQRKVQLLQQQQVQQAQSPVKPTLTGSQRMSQQYSELNDLLAQGTGLDTFGNTGEARIPAQFTKTGTFINSQGTGYKQMTSSNNPFLDTQFTGMISSNTAARIVPAETGYGFGNQQQLAQQQRQRNPNNLIDL